MLATLKVPVLVTCLAGSVLVALGALRSTTPSALAPGRVLWQSSSVNYHSPADVQSLEVRSAASIAALNGDPLPPGYTYGDWTGSAKAVVTSILPSGDASILVTLCDESTDLGELQIHVDDSLCLTANRANRLLQDAEGIARVRTSIVVDPTPPVSVEALWFGRDGELYRTDIFSVE